MGAKHSDINMRIMWSDRWDLIPFRVMDTKVWTSFQKKKSEHVKLPAWSYYFLIKITSHEHVIFKERFMSVQQNGNAIKSEKKQRKSHEADVAAHFHITEGFRVDI